MKIVVECRRCGAEYDVDRRTIIRGDWRRCPVCDPAPIDTDQDDETDDEPEAAA